MRCLVILILVAFTSARVINRNDCEGIVVNGISHTKETLKEYVDKPYQLAMDYNTNVLYFSYSTRGGDVFALAQLNLKNNEFDTISGVHGGFANGVDGKSHSVYFGGNDGIYKLNPDTKEAANLGVTDKNIWQLFFKDGLYFTTYPNEEAYLYKNGAVSKVAELDKTRAMLIGVDNDHNIFFSNSSGLFYYKKEDKKTTHVGDYTLNGITNDINGNIFFSTPTGIYSIDEETKKVKKLAQIINIYGIAIESDGSIIYASDDSIIRLKSTGQECFTDLEKKENSKIYK